MSVAIDYKAYWVVFERYLRAYNCKIMGCGQNCDCPDPVFYVEPNAIEGQNGNFGPFVDNDPHMVIEIAREGASQLTTTGPDVTLPEEQLVNELLTLAHEFGHFFSFREGNHSAEHNAARADHLNGKSLTMNQCWLIFFEEAYAWEIARKLLESSSVSQRRICARILGSLSVYVSSLFQASMK